MRILIICMLVLSGFFNVHADEVQEVVWTECEKTYIQPSQIRFSESAILVLLGELQWLRVPAIFVDDQGFYMTAFHPIEARTGFWVCKVCGQRNEDYRYKCEGCGKEKK